MEHYGATFTIDKSKLSIDDVLLNAHTEGAAMRLAQQALAATEGVVRVTFASDPKLWVGCVGSNLQTPTE